MTEQKLTKEEWEKVKKIVAKYISELIMQSTRWQLAILMIREISTAQSDASVYLIKKQVQR